MEDTSRLKAMHIIVWNGYLFSQPDSAMYFARLQYDLAEKAENKKWMAKALNTQGMSYYLQDLYTEALNCLNKSLQLNQALDNKEGITTCLSNIGLVYEKQGNYQMAMEHYQTSLKINRELGYTEGLSNTLNNIGILYDEQGNFDKALEYYTRSLQLDKENNNKDGIASSLNNIGLYYVSQKIYDKALAHFLQSITIKEQINNDVGLSYTYQNIGRIYLESGKLKQARKYFDQAITIQQKTGEKYPLVNALLGIGEIYYVENNLSAAILYGKQAFQLAQETNAIRLITESSEFLYKVYSKTNHTKALEMYELYIKMRDSIANEENTRALIQQEYQYEYDKKAAADGIRNAETIKLKNIQLQTQKTRTNYLIIGVFIMLLFLILAIYNYRAKRIANKTLQDQKKTMEEKNKELERLSIVASKTENIILIMDPEGNVEWVNNSFVKLNNLTMEELIAERGPNIKTISNNPDMAKIIEECIKSKSPYRYDSLNITSQGERVWESSTLTPIYDEQGVLNKFIIIDTDITKQKNAEELLNQKNKDITDSINYAQRIQNALLPSKEVLSLIPDGFILFQPKDIVSGDFYWMQQHNNRIYLAACDCTGHGVPGAFMSMISSSLLDEALLEKGITQPSEIFFEVRKGIIKALKQTEEAGSQKDGMDAVLCSWDQNGKLEYALAYNPFFLIRNGELIETKADKYPVGFHTGAQKPFTHHELKLEKGDTVYLFSDGYPDQFGGKKDKKFMMKNFKKLLLSIQDKTMNEQKTILEETMAEWKGDTEQVDDILVMGVRF